MTIQEAQSAARRNLPVVDDNPMLGPLLYARIGALRKDYALRADVEQGKPAELYSVELLPISAARSVTVVPLERVREATAEELRDISQYRGSSPAPEVHPELLCEEVRTGRPWADRKSVQ